MASAEGSHCQCQCKCLSTLKTFCLVTGASRGIGRACAVQVGKILKHSSTMVLVSRNEDDLNETKKCIGCIPIHVRIFPLDLSVPNHDKYVDVIEKALKAVKSSPSDFDHAIIIHNAGSLGDISKTAVNLGDADSWKSYLDFNVSSMAVLNSAFFNIFTKEEVKRRTAINITSLCAIKPFKSFGQYCAGKAAREMYMRVLALEDPSIIVLNYSPGPVETDMIDTLIEESIDDELRATYIARRKEKSMLTAPQTVRRMIRILADEKFKSGDHIDYFDEQ